MDSSDRFEEWSVRPRLQVCAVLILRGTHKARSKLKDLNSKAALHSFVEERTSR